MLSSARRESPSRGAIVSNTDLPVPFAYSGRRAAHFAANFCHRLWVRAYQAGLAGILHSTTLGIRWPRETPVKRW